MMGRILTIASQKGGVGKTTTTLNLGYTLARLGHRVLLVDTDPQGGMAVASNLRKKTTTGLAQHLKGEAHAEDVITPTKDGSMSIIGSGVMDPTDALVIEDASRDGRLEEALRELTRGFDYVFLDTPAGIGSTVMASLGISDGVILMLQCRSLVLKTLPIFLKLMRQVRSDRNPRLQLEGALVTLWRGEDPLEREILHDLTHSVPEALFFRTVIPFDENFEQASIRALPMILLQDGRDSARPYLELAMEMKERELLRGIGGSEDEHAEGLF